MYYIEKSMEDYFLKFHCFTCKSKNLFKKISIKVYLSTAKINTLWRNEILNSSNIWNLIFHYLICKSRDI